MKFPGIDDASFGLRAIDFEAAGRIDEERRAAAHFVAQQRHAGARLIEGFDDHVFEFFAQKLLDGGFVLFLHLGIIGQQADGAEIRARGIGLRRCRSH